MRGALVVTRNDQWFPTAVDGTNYPVLFGDTIYDTDNFFTPITPGVFTIPQGVTMARISASVIWSPEYTTGARQLVIKKGPNQEFFNGVSPDNRLAISGTTTDQAVHTPWIPVTPGDTFWAMVWQTSGHELAVLKSNGTWFAIEAI
jgi:hypothetical protein